MGWRELLVQTQISCPSLPHPRALQALGRVCINSQHLEEPIEQDMRNGCLGPKELNEPPSVPNGQSRAWLGPGGMSGQRLEGAGRGLNEACRQTRSPLPRGVMDQARYIIKNANFIYLPVCVLLRGRMSRLKSTLQSWAGLILALAESYNLFSGGGIFNQVKFLGPCLTVSLLCVSAPLVIMWAKARQFRDHSGPRSQLHMRMG